LAGDRHSTAAPEAEQITSILADRATSASFESPDTPAADERVAANFRTNSRNTGRDRSMLTRA
jgi:hypothetical protein